MDTFELLVAIVFLAIIPATAGLVILFTHVLPQHSDAQAQQPGKCTATYIEPQTYRCLEEKIDNLTRLTERLLNERQ
jgi:hypothetical protein